MGIDEEKLKELKKQLVLIAIEHLNMVDSRTLTVLQKNKIFESLDPKQKYEDILPVLSKKDHPDRIPVSSGPLLFCLVRKEPPETGVVNLAELFFSREVDVRKMVYDYFCNLEDQEMPFLTAKTIALLKAMGNTLLSTDNQKWRDASIAIFDAMNEDWYCSYSALKQCLQRKFVSGIEEYLTKVVRPSIPSVESVTIGIWDPSEQREEILQTISNIIEENTNFETALNRYYFSFGHLPYAGQLSFVDLVDKWQAKHGQFDNIWTILWTWADSFVIPLPRYHVCTYFASKPHLVSEDQRTILWHEIIEIIHIPNSENDDLEWTQAWRLLCELARHYCCHLETRLPFKNGERIASQAWWLSVQVCNLFCSDKKGIKQLRDETFLSESALSTRIWQIASPPIKPSSLRFMTLNTPSMFSLSLQAILGDNLDLLYPDSMAEEDRDKFEQSLSGSVLGVFPPKPKTSTDMTYLFENSVLVTARKWLDYMSEENENKEMIGAFVTGIEKLITSEDFGNIIMKFSGSHSGDQVIIANYLKNTVFTEEFSLDDIWKAINDSTWREAAFRKSHPLILQLIFDTLNEIECRYQDKWAYSLPHYYALELEKEKEPEKKKHLFGCVLRSSLCGNTVSAIQRIVKGENKHNYKEEIESWRKMLEEFHKRAPELVRSRIRPVLAALHL